MGQGGGETMSSSNGCGGVCKYEEIYLHAYDTVSDAQEGIARYLTFYDQLRPQRA